MPLATAISGPYTGTYSASSVGLTENGFRLRQSVQKDIVRADAYGGSAIDGIYRGGDCFLIYEGIEYSSAVAAFWPYATLGLMGQVGRLDVGTSIAAATVLTATAGTPAASTPATLTASQSIIDENFNGELLMAAKLRIVPISLRLYPYSSTGIRWFSTT